MCKDQYTISMRKGGQPLAFARFCCVTHDFGLCACGEGAQLDDGMMGHRVGQVTSSTRSPSLMTPPDIRTVCREIETALIEAQVPIWPSLCPKTRNWLRFANQKSLFLRRLEQVFLKNDFCNRMANLLNLAIHALKIPRN